MQNQGIAFNYDHLLGFGEYLGWNLVHLENPEMVRLWINDNSDDDFPIDLIISEGELLARSVYVKESDLSEDYAQFILRFNRKEGPTKIKPNIENGRVWPMIWTSISLNDLEPPELFQLVMGLYRTTLNFGEEALSRFALRKQFE